MKVGPAAAANCYEGEQEKKKEAAVRRNLPEDKRLNKILLGKRHGRHSVGWPRSTGKVAKLREGLKK